MTINIAINSRQIGDELTPTVNGRELHRELGVGKDYTSWAKAQIKRAHFEENRDFVLLTQKGEQLASGAKWSTEYHFTVEAGKHIGMLGHNQGTRGTRVLPRVRAPCEIRGSPGCSRRAHRRSDRSARPARRT